VPRDVLMDTLWPDASPDAARNNLHVVLTGVRQAQRLASAVSVLRRRHDAYGADVTWVDVEELHAHPWEGAQGSAPQFLSECLKR
jgi:DNA-binding SARP family transcriptional activator